MDHLSKAEKLVNDVVDNHESGLIREEDIEDDVTELVEIILEERAQRRLEGDDLEHAKRKLFLTLCLKNYLGECEPVNCAFRMSGECEYIDIIKKLNERKDGWIKP